MTLHLQSFPEPDVRKEAPSSAGDELLIKHVRNLSSLWKRLRCSGYDTSPFNAVGCSSNPPFFSPSGKNVIPFVHPVNTSRLVVLRFLQISSCLGPCSLAFYIDHYKSFASLPWNLFRPRTSLLRTWCLNLFFVDSLPFDDMRDIQAVKMPNCILQ